MSRSFLRTVSLALCWSLSPDALVLLGNNIGRSGMVFFVALLAGATLSAVAAYILHNPVLHLEDDGHDILCTKAGPFLAITLNFAGRLGPVLLLSTGMLVTAGFTFNETFVFWFPNFAFSFLLLFMVLVLHLCGERAVLAAQQVFFCLAAGCLLLLALAGAGVLTEAPPLQPPPSAPAGNPDFVPAFVHLIPWSMLFFLGYDQQNPGDFRHSPAAVVSGFVLLTLWGLASLRYVPQAKLAESTVPYVVAAKSILGQPGRLIMGIGIIAGACGVVNGLFYLSTSTLGPLLPGISNSNSTPTRPTLRSWPVKIQAVFMAVVIALFMALGLAGSENLQVYIFGALLLWLLTIGASCLAAAAHLQRHRKKLSALGYVAGGLLPAAAAYLVFTYPQPLLLGKFCLSVLIASAAVSVIWCRYGRKNRKPAINHAKGDKI